MKQNKIILYLNKKDFKQFLVYEDTGDSHNLFELNPPVEYVDNGVNKHTGELKEKWQIDKVKKTKNKLTVEFKLNIRKI